MKGNNRFSICFIVTLFLLFHLPISFMAPSQASANQSSITYENLSIYLMPQYSAPEGWDDKPAVFIGVYGTLKNGMKDESIDEVRLPIIQTGDDFHLELVGDTVDEKIESVEAEIDETTGEIVWQPNIEVNPGDTYDFLAEYYIAIDAEKTTYEMNLPYELERDAAMMDLLIFEPYNAEDFKVESNIDNVETTDQFGIKVHKLDVGEAQAEAAYDVKLFYEKRDRVTTSEAIGMLTEQAEQIAETSEAQADEEASFFTVENIVMAVIAIIVILLLLTFILKNRRKKKHE